MSSFVSGISGGQPSTTQPIATPWLSPKVVTRNIWPKVLKDIRRLARQSVLGCRNAWGHGGQTCTVIPGRAPNSGLPEFGLGLSKSATADLEGEPGMT